MKKFLLLSICILYMSSQAYAQVSLGIRGGFDLSTMKFESRSTGQKSSGEQFKNLHADLLLNVPLYGGLYLQPVFRYITKGTNFEPAVAEANMVNSEVGNRIKVRYIEMPVNLLYKFNFRGGKLAVGGGPYVAYGLGGSYNTDIITNGKVVGHASHSLTFCDEDNVVSQGMCLNRWDAGANVMVGVELTNTFMIGVNYSRGMVDLDNSGAYRVKNSYLGISVGILFNREDY
jgi:hypothetical protein